MGAWRLAHCRARMEARYRSQLSPETHWFTEQHTLQELLAGILLEECIMDHGAREVVNHKQRDGLDLILGVAGVVHKPCIL